MDTIPEYLNVENWKIAIESRSQFRQGIILRSGDLTVNLSTGEVTRAGRPVYLSMGEYRVLLALIGSRGQRVSIEQIGEMWHGGACEENIRAHVWRLRKKIEPNPYVPRYIVTVPGGYAMPPAE